MNDQLIEYVKDVLGWVKSDVEPDVTFRLKDITYNDSDGLIMTCEYSSGMNLFLTEDTIHMYVKSKLKNKLIEYGMDEIRYTIIFEKDNQWMIR